MRKWGALFVSMVLGRRGAALIRGKETLQLKAYLPTPNDVPTIGWGHTKDVKLGDTCTEEQAEMYFQADLAKAVRLVNVRMRQIGIPLSQSMFDALVVLTFNLEIAILSGHTVGDAWARRDYYGMFRGFCLYTKQGANDIRGLAIRRAQEMALFMEDPLPK